MGKLQSDKNVVGVTRPALDYQAIKKIIVPNLSLKFQENIERFIIKAFELNQQAKDIYSQAETHLLKELGFHNWQPTQANTKVKSFKNSFVQNERLDAEYYQPKYDEYFSKLIMACKDKNWELIKLGDLSEALKYGSSAPYDYCNSGIPFLRIADLSKL